MDHRAVAGTMGGRLLFALLLLLLDAVLEEDDVEKVEEEVEEAEVERRELDRDDDGVEVSDAAEGAADDDDDEDDEEEDDDEVRPAVDAAAPAANAPAMPYVLASRMLSAFSSNKNIRILSSTILLSWKSRGMEATSLCRAWHVSQRMRRRLLRCTRD